MEGMKGLRRTQSAVFSLLLAATFVSLTLPARGESVNSLPQPTDYVSDDAHVLSPEAIARLDSICQQLDHTKANSQIAVVTIHTLDGDDAADYADQLESKWKMGRKGSDKGALVLLAVDDHKYRIEVGYGLEGILPDGKVGDIGRDMVPYLKANDYDSAVTLAVGEMAQVIAADAQVTLNMDALPAQQAPEEDQAPHGAVVGKLILLLFVLIFFGGSSILRLLLGYGLLSSIFGGRSGGSGWGGGGFGGGGGGGGFGGFGGGGFGGGGAGGSW